MDVIKLCSIFAVIIVIMWLKKPLYLAILCGTATTSLLYQINIPQTALIVVKSMTSWSTLSIILICYLITFLQRMLEKRGHLNLAQKSLNGLFHNRRINASLAPVFIGLLPSPGAVFICGSMVEASCKDYLPKEDIAFVTSYYRHIPESFLPTYSSIIIAMQLSGVAMSSFLVAMFPMVVVLVALGFVFYLRKVPKETGEPTSQNRWKDFKSLVLSLWSIALTIFLIIAFNVQVYVAAIFVIVLFILVNKFHWKELAPMIHSAWEWNIVINTFVVMIFKDIMTQTGVIAALPAIFGKLPIPTVMAFALIFFFGTLISGSMAIIVMCIPMAFATVPGAGLPLMVLLMSYTYAAMQLSPTHICLALVTQHFSVGMGSLIKRTIPVMATFCTIVAGYYLLLKLVF